MTDRKKHNNRIPLPITKQFAEDIEKQLPAPAPFGRQLIRHMGWTLRRIQEGADLLEEPANMQERTLEQEIAAAKGISQTAFNRWAVRMIRKAGAKESADLLEQAQDWEERSKQATLAMIGNKRSEEGTFTPMDEALLAAVKISGRMKNLEKPDQLLSIQRRLENLTEEIATAGYALAWGHQESGEEFDLRTEFTQALSKAGVTS